MFVKDNTMIISGCLPYRTRKEKKAAFRQLKKEFGDNATIRFEDQFITYRARVDRNLYF